MGALFKGQCLADGSSAVAQYCAASYPSSQVDSSGAASTVTCAAVDASTASLTWTPATGSPVVSTVSLTFPACDALEGYTDLAALWSLGLLGIVAVWAVKSFVYKLVANQ